LTTSNHHHTLQFKTLFEIFRFGAHWLVYQNITRFTHPLYQQILFSCSILQYFLLLPKLCLPFLIFMINFVW